MRITSCTQEDFQQIHLDFDSFWPGIDEAKLHRLKILHHPTLIHEFGNTALVIKQNHKVIAYLFGFYSQTEPLGYVHAIAVHQDHRRAGLASQLYKHFIQLAKAKGCHTIKAITSPSNSDSLHFHASLGMVAKIMKDYSGPGEDRVILTKTI